jgi:hypothetical protein
MSGPPLEPTDANGKGGISATENDSSGLSAMPSSVN